jgi:hypothetical protein
MERPLTTESDIGSKVKGFLGENGFNANYDPSKGTYRPWYRREVEVNYVEKGRRFSELSGATFSFKNKEIEIPTDGHYKTIEDVASALLHETGHADIWPVEFPLLVAGCSGVIHVVAGHFDDPLKGIGAAIGGLLVYHYTVGELITEGYSAVKYGVKKYLKLRLLKKSESTLADPKQ